MKSSFAYIPTRFAIVAAFTVTLAISASAQDHPAYLHALTNLRAARWLISNRPGGWEQTDNETAAMHAIEVAVYEIIKVDIDDGKYYNQVPEVDNIDIPDRQGRLDRAEDFLRKARTDVNHDENDAFAGGLKSRVLTHIDEALRLTERAVASK